MIIHKDLRKVYELMGKLSPDFKLNEADSIQNTFNSIDNVSNTAQKKVDNVVNNTIDKTQNVQYIETGNYRLQTYGDLKKAVNVIKLKQKGNKLSGKGIEAIIGAIPVIGNAKTVYDLIKAGMEKPDNKKTNTWLDKLDVDDNMSEIIDDTVENGFLEYMVNKINSTPDNTPLDPGFNMNDELAEYLKQKYDNRTVVGYQK